MLLDAGTELNGCSMFRANGDSVDLVLSSSVGLCYMLVYWRYVALVVILWRAALSASLSSSSASVIAQMRTSKCTCLIFGVSIGLDPG